MKKITLSVFLFIIFALITVSAYAVEEGSQQYYCNKCNNNSQCACLETTPDGCICETNSEQPTNEDKIPKPPNEGKPVPVIEQPKAEEPAEPPTPVEQTKPTEQAIQKDPVEIANTDNDPTITEVLDSPPKEVKSTNTKNPNAKLNKNTFPSTDLPAPLSSLSMIALFAGGAISVGAGYLYKQ